MNTIYLIFNISFTNGYEYYTFFPEKYFLEKPSAESYLLENGWKKNENKYYGEHFVCGGRIAVIKEVEKY